MERLKGKNALITGASSGIGQAIAVRFAAEGTTSQSTTVAEPNRPRPRESCPGPHAQTAQGAN